MKEAKTIYEWRGGVSPRAGHRLAAVVFAGVALGGSASSADPAEATTAGIQDERGDPLRYVLAGETGADLRNIGDKKGLVVLRAERDTPLAVHEEKGAWLRVEAPGGYQAWIFGQYLAPAGAQGWYTVTGSPVLLRPLPESSNRSFPVDRVYTGDRVRLIERQDVQRSLAEDWARIWSPGGTTAWVLAAETRKLEADEDGAALWNAAQSAVLAARASAPSDAHAEPASAPGPGAGEAVAKGEAGAAFQAAEEMLEALPDSADLAQLALVRGAYEKVLELAPDAPTQNLVQSRLELVGLREELARIRVDLAENRVRNEERKKELEVEIAEANRKKDPLWGRFTVRGWLVEEKGEEGPVYLVRWAGDTEAQIVCTSGRYELDQFLSYEVGVEGYRVPLDGALAPVRIDVRKLEVISGRPSGRR